MKGWEFFAIGVVLSAILIRWCPNLFELDSDDGVREWGVELRPNVTDDVRGLWRLTGYYEYPEGGRRVLRGISFVNSLINL
jgi:hypothetical protein